MIIAGVLAGGMAEAAGLQAGDRVSAIAGIALRDLCELGEALRGCGANDAVELVIDRAEPAEIRVPVIAAPRDEAITYGELTFVGR